MAEEFIKNSRIGKLYFKFEGDVLVKTSFVPDSKKAVSRNSNHTVDTILEFLNKPGIDLARIKVQLNGTEFQKKVWRAIVKIPFGKTLTYKELATRLKSHPRPVASALRRNPVPLVFPCHRVVAQTGIGGFAGKTEGKMVTIKRKLLSLENPEFNG